jgi:hypothetical protein
MYCMRGHVALASFVLHLSSVFDLSFPCCREPSGASLLILLLPSPSSFPPSTVLRPPLLCCMLASCPSEATLALLRPCVTLSRTSCPLSVRALVIPRLPPPLSSLA